jgi:hypothetical protein
MTFPFFFLVVWSGIDFPVSYRWFDWLLLAVGFAYSALAQNRSRKRRATLSTARRELQFEQPFGWRPACALPALPGAVSRETAASARLPFSSNPEIASWEQKSSEVF